MAKLGWIADQVGGTVAPEWRDVTIERLGAIAQADAQTLVFAEGAAQVEAALAGAAAAVLVGPRAIDPDGTRPAKPLVEVAQPKLAFARAGKLLNRRGHESATTLERGDENAFAIAASAIVSRYAVLGEGVRIGDRSVVGAGCVLGAGVMLGEECVVHPRVTVYPGVRLGNRVVVHAGAVLGADGFGYVRDAETGEQVQFPQQGTLVIEDDVEIGANATIDRGALEATRIGQGTKIDNLVHVGHNVRIGRNVVIAAQTGISGSAVIGDGAVIAGQVGIADHVEIGAGVVLGAQAGVPSNKRLRGAGEVFWGTPARPIREYLKELAARSRRGKS